MVKPEFWCKGGKKILLHPSASLTCHHWKQGEALDHAKLSLSPLRERRDEEIIWHKSGPTEDLNYRYEQSAVFKDMYRKYRKWVFSSQWKFPCRKQPWKEWGKEEKSVEGKKWRRKKRGFAVLNVQPAKYTDFTLSILWHLRSLTQNGRRPWLHPGVSELPATGSAMKNKHHLPLRPGSV